MNIEKLIFSSNVDDVKLGVVLLASKNLTDVRQFFGKHGDYAKDGRSIKYKIYLPNLRLTCQHTNYCKIKNCQYSITIHYSRFSLSPSFLKITETYLATQISYFEEI